MSKYEFSLRQEVLMEVGASILGDLFRYSEENEIENDADPVNILYNLIRTAKQNIILSKTEEELEQIEGQFCLAGNFLSGKEGKGGFPMAKRTGFCLETQFYPDTPHRPDFPNCLYKAGDAYESETVYAFSVSAQDENA